MPRPSYIEWTDNERRKLATAVKQVRVEQPHLSSTKIVLHAMTMTLAPDRQRPLVSVMQLSPWLDQLLEELGDQPICRVPQPQPPESQELDAVLTRLQAGRTGADLDQIFAQVEVLVRAQVQVRQDVRANNDSLVSAVTGLHAAVSRLTGEVHLLKRQLKAKDSTADELPSVLVVGYSDQHQKEVITQACDQRARVRFMDMDHLEEEPHDDWVIGTQWTPKRWWDRAHANLDPTSMVFVPGDAQDIVKQIFELVGG